MKDLPKDWANQLIQMIAASTTNNTSLPQNTTHADDNKGGKANKEPIEKLLMKVVSENRNLFFDRNQNTYIEVQDIKQFQPINKYLIKTNSEEFREWITYEIYTYYYKIPSNAQIEGVKRFLSREAVLKGEKIELYNRVASIDGAIYIDMGTRDRKIIKVDKTGWFLDYYQVHFRRLNHMEELPVPIQGGKIKEILKYFPPLPERDQCLILCWLVASFVEHIQRAFLFLEGSAGSGKTTLSLILKSLIDPMADAAISYNDNENEVAQIIDHQFVPVLDNLTTISRKLSNMFCRVFSGGSHLKKELYTDDKDFILCLSGNIIFNSIKLLQPKSDFLDRCYKVQVPKTELSYRSKELFAKKFEEEKPMIFGALLTTISETLKKVDTIPVIGTYRTVDFDRYCAAASDVLGYGNEYFLSARKHCEDIKKKSITSSNPLAEAMFNFLKANNNFFSGYMGKLLAILPNFTNSPEALPKRANYLSKKLNELSEELKEVGISGGFKHNDHNGALWQFSLKENHSDSEIEVSEKNELESGVINVEDSYQNNGQSYSDDNVDSTNSPDPNPFLDDIEVFSSIVSDISKEDIDNVEIDYCDVIKRVMKK